jgi:hypothetical protein
MKFNAGQLREQMILVSAGMEYLFDMDNKERLIKFFAGGLNLKFA